ncbi:hypothetical protein [Amycolatopsis albispora]|uniref:hypothetical protein n=1 Tax=Amycolatopsis albispora TaxID=1804986 RepID=UPI000DE4EDC6|nr:hypothetical protein [Amycolatopsis albispora]
MGFERGPVVDPAEAHAAREQFPLGRVQVRRRARVRRFVHKAHFTGGGLDERVRPPGHRGGAVHHFDQPARLTTGQPVPLLQFGREQPGALELLFLAVAQQAEPDLGGHRAEPRGTAAVAQHQSFPLQHEQHGGDPLAAERASSPASSAVLTDGRSTTARYTSTSTSRRPASSSMETASSGQCAYGQPALS